MGTEIGRVRGLGSAGHGAQHWWHHKLTAGSNFLLLVWLLASIAMLPSYDHATVKLWLSSAWAAVPMVLFIVSVFYHFRLGLQIVIEDYSHKESRFVLTVLATLFTVGTAGVAIFSILKVAFGATA
ncbi:succinate dehydrogenase, hydrophobic membrane anchor protein [Sphingomonas endophytica]|uniref:Succinate dehydrogenase hydrophobic membrane anchor subunit n=1 Tax=Sphingomonas endophytica TaxID=869719 RepID=A0A147HYQ9_9SPHN|nr:succinate dehydrogenase, hydrophobic membrane anchor protein [Sphingomonas endophytica]KTT70123.1 succinate dehydrogenase [Sphingomonas endophytica]